MGIEDVVKKRIADDSIVAKDAAAALKPEDLSDIDSGFKKIFADRLDSIQGRHWSNIPIGKDARPMKLSHYLIVGVPAVLDLEPKSRDQFELDHGVTIHAVEDLADQGRVILNLHARKDPAKWAGSEHLLGLVEKSAVIGERVDCWLEALSQARHRCSFRDLTKDDERQQAVLEALAQISDDRKGEILKLSCEKAIDGVPKLLCHQWAYLDVLRPDAAVRFGELIAEGKLAEALKYNRIMRRMYASPYTAAMGGELVWGGFDQDQYASLMYDPSAAPAKRFSEAELVFGTAVPEAWQILVQELAGPDGHQVAERVNVDSLCALQKSEGWAERKDKIFDTLLELTKLANENNSQPASVAALKELLAEEQETLRRFEIYGEMGSDAICFGLGTLVGKALELGTVQSGFFGIVTKGALELIAGKRPGDFGKEIGSALHGIARPEQHRVLVNLNELKKHPR